MKKIGLIIIPLILLLPIAYSDSCNTACLKKSYSSGVCSSECESNLTIPGAADCPKFGQAVLVIGTTSINKYENAESYVSDDIEDQEWVWIIKNLKTKASTYIRDTSDDTRHTGPIIGIKNNFLADTLTSTPNPAVKAGGKFCLPEEYLCIEFISLIPNTYANYEISKTTVDLSSFNSSWSSKAAIYINSITDANGLKLQQSGWDFTFAADATTDRMWIINNGSSYAGIFYEDSTNTKKLAGYINMNSGSVDKNIADINYQNTKDNNIQIDLRGDFGTANNLDLALDILGEEGSASTDSNDDLIINLMHTANNDFQGFGTTSASAEDADLVWASTNIGKKETDLRTLYGMIIKNPKQNADSDKVSLEIPNNQVYANISLSGKSTLALTSPIENETKVLGDIVQEPMLASELINKQDYNIIFVGGPCANPLIEEYKEFPKCSAWNLAQGEAIIKLTKNGMNTALLVAGTTAEDTRMATQFFKDKFPKLKLEGKTILLKKGNMTKMSGETFDIDFSDYPYPFIQNGKINTLFVFGDKAKSDDTIGASDIASALMKITRNTVLPGNKTEGYTGTTATSYKIPLGNNIGDANYFSKLLTYGDIKTLRDGTVQLSGEDIPVKDTVELYNSGPIIQTSLSSNDFTYGSDVVLELAQGRLRYYYVFDKEVDLTQISASKPLDIKFLNSEFSITEIDTNKITTQSATRYFLNIGEVVKIDNDKLKLVDIGDTGELSIEANISNNLTRRILQLGQRINIQGVDIKNINTYKPGSEEVSCCCTDLLSFLK